MKNDLMLHVCCGPCACYPFEVLEEEFNITSYWFNPNIHGYGEYLKRLRSFYVFLHSQPDSKYIEDEYSVDKWFLEIQNEKNKEERCRRCYTLRLERTAAKAKSIGIDMITSTLLYSKFQIHDEIKSIGSRMAEKFGLKFFYYDFREGWKKGIEKSKTLKLYRQNYCGCIFSEIERENVS